MNESPRHFVIFARQTGLFSLMLQVIGHCWKCRKRGSTPIVFFNRQCLYWSDAGYNGARNVWEYYFEPVSAASIFDVTEADADRLERSSIWAFSRRETELQSFLPLDEQLGAIRVREDAVVSDRFPRRAIDWIWEMSVRHKLALHREIVERVRVRSHVASKIEDFFATHMAGLDVLGVHIRGAERAKERTYLAPAGELSLDCYFREIDAYLAAHPRSAIFCATDVETVLDAMTRRYGDRVLSYAATRLAPADEAVGLHYLPPSAAKARLGEDVVVECYLLSRCRFLLHGMSNVSLFARLINLSLPHLNVYEKYGFVLPRLVDRLGLPRMLDTGTTFAVVHQVYELWGGPSGDPTTPPPRAAVRLARALLPPTVRSDLNQLLALRSVVGTGRLALEAFDWMAFWRPAIRTMHYKGFKLFYKRGNLCIARARGAGTWEPDVTRHLVDELKRSADRVFLDAGANIGLMTLNVLAGVPDARVFAFEPGPDASALLARTVAENGLEDRVHCHAVALGEAIGTRLFALHTNRYNALDGFKNTERAPVKRVIPVPQQTLDVWWRTARCPPVSVVKIDTEGAELWILEGAVELLAQCRPVIFLEINPVNLQPYPYGPQDIANWLNAHGYRLEQIDGSPMPMSNNPADWTREDFIAHPVPR